MHILSTCPSSFPLHPPLSCTPPVLCPSLPLLVAAVRDLKPANLMIGGSYIESAIQRRILLHELGTVKIADFGACWTLGFCRRCQALGFCAGQLYGLNEQIG